MTEKQDGIFLLGLDEMMDDAPMPLMQAKLANPDDDILINWPIEVDVKTRGLEKYLVCVALNWSKDNEEAVREVAEQLCTPPHQLIFASMNVADYGSDKFAILIEENSFGEVLVNSLVQEVIAKAGIEEAVISWSSN